MVTQGSWVSDGGVVLEAAFADSLDVGVGDSVGLGGRSFKVVGVAVTAAMPPYPGASCIVSAGCINGAIPDDRDLPAGLLHNPGLVWLTQADVRSLASDRGPLPYVMNLKLADPDEAQAFVDRTGDHGGAMPVQTWQSILADATDPAEDSQILLLIGAWLLGLLAVEPPAGSPRPHRSLSASHEGDQSRARRTTLVAPDPTGCWGCRPAG